MVSEAVNMTATTMPKIMAIHDEQKEAEYAHQQQINEITSSDDRGRAKKIIAGSVEALVTLPENVL